MRTSLKPARFATTVSYVERVNLAIDHVLAHLDEPLRLRELSRRAMLSPFHFHRVFQSLVGETPADFVRRARLDRALNLMAQQPRPTLTRIALQCGFSSSSDFSRAFRRRFGVAPRAFDLGAWRAKHAATLDGVVRSASRVAKLPSRANPDGFRVRTRTYPARGVAYIRVDRPYEGTAVFDAAQRLMAWARREGVSGQWLGYQWESPELSGLDHCRYYVAVVCDRARPRGEVGVHRFPPMTVARMDLKGDLDLELRALRWLYASWLPRSGLVPDDQPAFEAWCGMPFAHGMEHFELAIELPVRAWR